ncbi:hypothetical protein NM688_g6993 [Phlebia brevispora]|uniref:Uncharacterized protein n=1 Tax=Phlebia brevispora TaxID=194682 RepID=A0ACC1SA57_9APHY|nr:hypothetical protein NM688_g6993 [Phlebia brevispora]
MKIAHVHAKVRVEGSSLEEYDTRYNEEEGRGSCYIASRTGKSFKVLASNTMPDTDLECFLYVDGVLAVSGVVRRRATQYLHGVSTGPDTVRPFQFSRLELTDNDDSVTMAHNEIDLQHLGTIRCDFFRVRVLGPSTREHLYTIPPGITNRLVLHEKTKKAGTQRVLLAEEEKMEPEHRVRVKSIDSRSGDPFRSFLFRYRPREMLQAQGIIPTQGSSSPNTNGKRPGPDEAGPSKRTRTNNDDQATEGRDVKAEGAGEDLEGLLVRLTAKSLMSLRFLRIRFIQAARAALDARIQAEEERRVKREPSPIVLVGSAKGEVIDLTQD